MSDGRYSFWRLGKHNKILLASVLGTVLFLSTLTPVLNIPILPSSSLLPAAIAQQQGKETEDVPDEAELAAMNDAEAMTKKDDKKFEIVEATIEDIHDAIKTNQVTCEQLIHQYIDRIKAYNGQCVQPAPDPLGELPGYTGPLNDGFLAPSLSDPSRQLVYETIAPTGAKQLNALITVNIRGERSVTCSGDCDNDPNKPDALERARQLDEEFAQTGELSGPLHCIPFALKDVFDVSDMRSTGGSDVLFADDRSSADSTIAARIRQAGGIVLAQANLDEMNAGGQGRSTFGGQTCNAYNTNRSPGGSSSGSAVAVAANLMVCAIAEETGGSVRNPATNANIVGLVGSRGLLSDHLMSPSSFYRDRAGLHCRTVMDTAIALDALVGYDPKDEDTTASVGRLPDSYVTFANKESLDGVRIGVIREHMIAPSLNDRDSVRIINEAIADLQDLGATVVESVDPLYMAEFGDDPNIANMETTFQDAIAEILHFHEPAFLLTSEFSPPVVDDVDFMVQMSLDPSLLPQNADLRELQVISPGADESKYAINRYLQLRNDSNIDNIRDYVSNATFFSEAFANGREEIDNEQSLNNEGNINQILRRQVLQRVVLKVMADNQLDVLVEPVKTIPANIIGGPTEPTAMNRPAGRYPLSPIGGFPEIVVPAGFTQIVYDPQRIVDPNNSNQTIVVSGATTTTLPGLGLPVAIGFLGRPYEEPKLFEVASAYEAATHHRMSPPDFGPLSSFPIEHMSNSTASAGYGVYSQKPARVEYITEDSELVGDKIDSVTLSMKRVGTINGTAEIGILNEDLSVKKLFGTLDVTTLTPTYTDYEFKLTDDELYTVEAGDRIGVKYTGGSLESTSWVSVMLDLDAADPFDGANSYLQYHYQGTWRNSPDRDLYMTLVQTHG
jgi:Asp-tRNA(Asn)/Glu-tRNA(Gln) amidotransferase A subunit family amidase